MHYVIYSSSNNSLKIDYETRDETAGLIGSLQSGLQPLLIGDSREEVQEKAYAHLGRNPADSLYLADSSGRLYEILINRQYHRDRDSLNRSSWRGWACFVLATLSLLVTASLGLGILGVAICAASLSLFVVLVKTSAFKEVEACVICGILLVITALLLPKQAPVAKTSPDRNAIETTVLHLIGPNEPSQVSSD